MSAKFLFLIYFCFLAGEIIIKSASAQRKKLCRCITKDLSCNLVAPNAVFIGKLRPLCLPSLQLCCEVGPDSIDADSPNPFKQNSVVEGTQNGEYTTNKFVPSRLEFSSTEALQGSSTTPYPEDSNSPTLQNMKDNLIPTISSSYKEKHENRKQDSGTTTNQIPFKFETDGTSKLDMAHEVIIMDKKIAKPGGIDTKQFENKGIYSFLTHPTTPKTVQTPDILSVVESNPTIAFYGSISEMDQLSTLEKMTSKKGNMNHIFLKEDLDELQTSASQLVESSTMADYSSLPDFTKDTTIMHAPNLFMSNAQTSTEDAENMDSFMTKQTIPFVEESRTFTTDMQFKNVVTTENMLWATSEYPTRQSPLIFLPETSSVGDSREMDNQTNPTATTEVSMSTGTDEIIDIATFSQGSLENEEKLTETSTLDSVMPVEMQPELFNPKDSVISMQPELLNPLDSVISMQPELLNPLQSVISIQPELLNPLDSVISKDPELLNPLQSVISIQPELLNPQGSSTPIKMQPELLNLFFKVQNQQSKMSNVISTETEEISIDRIGEFPTDEGSGAETPTKYFYPKLTTQDSINEINFQTEVTLSSPEATQDSTPLKEGFQDSTALKEELTQPEDQTTKESRVGSDTLEPIHIPFDSPVNLDEVSTPAPEEDLGFFYWLFS